MGDVEILNALADALDTAAMALRRRAELFARDGQPEAATVAELESAVAKARALHPMLGPRQAEVLDILERYGAEGTNTGVIAKAMSYDQPNVYLTLQALATLGFVQKDDSASPHVYRLTPKLAISTLELDLPRVASGKVRELFDAGEHLLMVATDRISVFDVVLPTPIPDKGAVLNGLSVFWFEHTKGIVQNHLVEWRASKFGVPEAAGRGMLVRRAEILPIECIVRGYLSGSGWDDYQRMGQVCGIDLPKGLRESDRLPEPLFTPSTKAETGHDENIDIDTAGRILGDASLAKRLGEVAIALYEAGARHAESRGIILADTKFEFGLIDGELVLCDEAMTPDSSRYWPAAAWEPGKAPPSFDKQYVRDYTEGLGWNKAYPGPKLPQDVVEGTRTRYVEAYEWISGRSFADYLAESK